MAVKKQKTYDDYVLAQDIAESILTRKQIAKRHGVSEALIGQIARGDTRADLQPLISKISEAHITELKRIARSRARKIMRRLDTIMDSDDEDTSLKAIKQICALGGADKDDESGDTLRAVVIRTPFAIDPSKVKSRNGSNGNGRKNGNGAKKSVKKSNGKNGRKKKS